MAGRLRDEGILCLSSSPWDGLWTRKQLLMQGLSESNRILYVEPQLSAGYLVRTGRARRLRGRGLHRDGSVAILGPPPALPLHTGSQVIQRLNLRLLRHALRGALARLGWDPTILWFYDPALALLCHGWPNASVVYDCVDRHDAYPGRRRLVGQLEQVLAARADVVTATSRALVADLRAVRDDVVLVPNGVDLGLFVQSDPLPAGLLPPGRPRIGFVGGIGEWIDTELLDHMATGHPDWWLCLAGPVAPGVKVGSLCRRPNVHLTGRIARRSVPAFLREMDVCILPFKVNRLTAAVNPLKLFEYFAAGKPVVATDMDEVRPFAPLVKIAETREDFSNSIAQLLSCGDGLEAARRAAARQNSWSVLLPRLEAVVAERLETHRC
jgi:glycosyltransferase involved in cell wall biosynthesis